MSDPNPTDASTPTDLERKQVAEVPSRDPCPGVGWEPRRDGPTWLYTGGNLSDARRGSSPETDDLGVFDAPILEATHEQNRSLRARIATLEAEVARLRAFAAAHEAWHDRACNDADFAKLSDQALDDLMELERLRIEAMAPGGQP